MCRKAFHYTSILPQTAKTAARQSQIPEGPVFMEPGGCASIPSRRRVAGPSWRSHPRRRPDRGRRSSCLRLRHLQRLRAGAHSQTRARGADENMMLDSMPGAGRTSHLGLQVTPGEGAGQGSGKLTRFEARQPPAPAMAADSSRSRAPAAAFAPALRSLGLRPAGRAGDSSRSAPLGLITQPAVASLDPASRRTRTYFTALPGAAGWLAA